MRSFKLCEFTAHGAAVNCAVLGRKSGQVLATGGDDRRVNIWTVGKTAAVMVSAPPLVHISSTPRNPRPEALMRFKMRSCQLPSATLQFPSRMQQLSPPHSFLFIRTQWQRGRVIFRERKKKRRQKKK
jgi:WD40 repeat protein